MSSIKYIQNIISGPHLNEKHFFYVKHDFYAKLYCKLLSTYLTFTDFKSINTFSWHVIIDIFLQKQCYTPILNK